MGDPTFIDRFRAAGRPGFYARVLMPGVGHTGDPVRVQARQSGVTLNALFRLWYKPHPEPNELEHALAAPIAVRMRARYEKLLAALNA
jgi:MOSC domain-containing protein YiiM